MGLRLASSHNNNSEYKPCNYYPIRDGKVDKASYNTGLFDKEGKLVYKVRKLNLEKTYKLSNGNFLSKSFKNSSYNLYSKDLELLATEVTPDETYTLFRNDNCQYFDISGKNILNPAKANALGNNLIQMDATIYEIEAGSSIKEFIATKGTTIFTINREQWVDECSDVSDTEALTPTYKHIIRKIGTSFTFTFYSKDSDINIYREFNNEAVSIYIPSYPYLYTDKDCLLKVAYFGLK